MIKYQYEVKSVNEQHGVMEVLYTAEYLTPILIGMPLPTTTQSLEQVVAQYAPLPQWEQENAVRVVPKVGTGGTVDPLKTDPQVQSPVPSALEVTPVTLL